MSLKDIFASRITQLSGYFNKVVEEKGSPIIGGGQTHTRTKEPNVADVDFPVKSSFIEESTTGYTPTYFIPVTPVVRQATGPTLWDASTTYLINEYVYYNLNNKGLKAFAAGSTSLGVTPGSSASAWTLRGSDIISARRRNQVGTSVSYDYCVVLDSSVDATDVDEVAVAVDGKVASIGTVNGDTGRVVLDSALSSITDEALGNGDGVTTEFSTAFTPICNATYGLPTANTAEVTVYFNGVTTVSPYTLNGTAGTVTFSSAPSNSTAVTIDYNSTLAIQLQESLGTADGGTAPLLVNYPPIVDVGFGPTATTNQVAVYLDGGATSGFTIGNVIYRIVNEDVSATVSGETVVTTANSPIVNPSNVVVTVNSHELPTNQYGVSAASGIITLINNAYIKDDEGVFVSYDVSVPGSINFTTAPATGAEISVTYKNVPRTDSGEEVLAVYFSNPVIQHVGATDGPTITNVTYVGGTLTLTGTGFTDKSDLDWTRVRIRVPNMKNSVSQFLEVQHNVMTITGDTQISIPNMGIINGNHQVSIIVIADSKKSNTYNFVVPA